MDKEAIEREVAEQFKRVIVAINDKDANAWSRFYSGDGFVSAIAGTDHYAARSAWVDQISGYFSERERQHVQPLAVRVTALASDLALLTSEEDTRMWLRDGSSAQGRHAFTMLWKRESDGWKILHSHESWLDQEAQ